MEATCRPQNPYADWNWDKVIAKIKDKKLRQIMINISNIIPSKDTPPNFLRWFILYTFKEKKYHNHQSFVLRILYNAQAMYRLIIQSKKRGSFEILKFRANSIIVPLLKLGRHTYNKYFKPKNVPQLYSDIIYYDEFDLTTNQCCAKYSKIYLDKLERHKLNYTKNGQPIPKRSVLIH